MLLHAAALQRDLYGMANGNWRRGGFMGQVSDCWLFRLTEATIYVVMSVRPSIRLSAGNNSALSGQSFV